jgi:peptide/nickel transport system ATP-binding protein
VAEIADKVAIMYAGKIVELGPSEKIYTSPAHPYTKGLMASIPRIGGAKELSWIPGSPPDLRTPPPGCRFHPRCPFAMEICRKEEPPYFQLDRDHISACWLHKEGVAQSR